MQDKDAARRDVRSFTRGKKMGLKMGYTLSIDGHLISFTREKIEHDHSPI